MKNYRITVNGVEYEVQVEEIGAEEMTQTAAPARKAAAPAAHMPFLPKGRLFGGRR